MKIIDRNNMAQLFTVPICFLHVIVNI